MCDVISSSDEMEVHTNDEMEVHTNDEMEVHSSNEMEVHTTGETNGVAEHKTFHERLSDMPAYTMTMSQLQSIYATLKERNDVLKNAFTAGEQYAEMITNAAKPVVWAATASAFKVAKPVVGEVEDPAATIDSCASEALAKVQEKLPFMKQTPSEVAETAKTSAKETANYYVKKVQTSTIGKETVKQVDNVVSFSELLVEICFPTDGTNAEDVQESEKAEQDEDKGVLIRAGNLKDKAYRRSKRKLMTYQPVQTSVHMVQYAQSHVADMTDKLKQGTNYISTKSAEAKDTIVNTYPEVKNIVHENVMEGSRFVKENWDHIYKTTMYIPRKALQVTGEVYISGKEIVFAYTKAHSPTEMPHAIAEMTESYYASLKKEVPTVDEIKEKAVAFVYVPAQVVSEYLKSTRAVQWIVPKSVDTEKLQVMETVPEESEI